VSAKLLYETYNKDSEGETLQLFLYKNHYFINDSRNEVSALWIKRYSQYKEEPRFMRTK